jgi:hypothetical protein
MRESLFALAAAAGAWAVGVLGIATNKPFGVYLLVVAFLMFVAAHRDVTLIDWWKRRPRD